MKVSKRGKKSKSELNRRRNKYKRKKEVKIS